MKALIIKTGEREVFEPDGVSNGDCISLGDVLVCTCLLPRLASDGYEVTWITSKEAEPLLRGNPLIHKLQVSGVTREIPISRNWQVIINLERTARWCGYKNFFIYETCYGYTTPDQATILDERPIGEVIYGLCGLKWQGQMPQMADRGIEPKWDVGLNCCVGDKWPNKSWPDSYWAKLAKQLTEKGFSVSWQAGKDNLDDYLDWLASCRLTVSCDSLGLHASLALDRQAVGLFGPTHPKRVYTGGRGRKIRAAGLDEGICARPCYDIKCKKSIDFRNCMYSINPLEVATCVESCLRPENRRISQKQGVLP